jgi:hypothetical protein
MLLAPLLAAGCDRLPKQVMVPVPPEKVGAWRRAAMDTPDIAGAPAAAAALKPGTWIRVSYAQGQKLVGVSLFGFTTDAAAFELQQKWDRSTGDVTFQRKATFVVCRSESLTSQELVAFVKEFEGAWR